MKRKLTSEIDRDMVIAFIKRLDLRKLYTVEVTERKANRSISQNSLYWLWLTCIEFETGTDRNDLHDYFKRKYLIPESVFVFGESQERYSTTKLNTTQFKYYLDHIQTFVSTELAIALPDPESQYWDEFYKFYVDKL
jgi:hypothetical protein